MNKGYLILEDGRVLSGRTDAAQNAFGRVNLTGSEARIENMRFMLDDAFGYKDDQMIGKIVVDQLPLEYHMYDVKNTLLI